MKASPYTEVFWDIAAGPEEGLVLQIATDEAALFEKLPLETIPFSLPSALERLVVREEHWRRVPVEPALARDVGANLWSALPPDATRTLAEPGGTTTRLKVSVSEPTVAELPWEWLVADGGEHLALRPDIRFVRSVPLKIKAPPASTDVPLRVLILVTNPKNESLVESGIEVDAISRRLRSSEYEVRFLGEPTLDGLARELRDFSPHILHYVGHAGLSHGQGHIILEDWEGRSHWIAASELGFVLPPSVRLLCLSTPFTAENYEVRGFPALASAPSRVPLPTAVVNQYAVDEPAVVAFWNTFYERLAQTTDVNDAVHAGRLAVAAEEPHHADWGSFSCVIRDKTGVPFDLRRVEPPSDARLAVELQAHYASKLANELAEQMIVLGEAIPDGVREQYERESQRASALLERLDHEESL
jgi:hypothetical protein